MDNLQTKNPLNLAVTGDSEISLVTNQIGKNEMTDATIITDSGINASKSQYNTVGQHIETRHYQEWSRGSGISDSLIELNLESLSDRSEIKKILGWANYKNDLGWNFRSVDLARPYGSRQKSKVVSFKPDTPIQFNEGDKPVRYFGAKGLKDILIPEMPDPNYWQDFLRSNAPIVISEGIKKVLAVVTASNLPAMGLTGVTVWGNKDGKKKNLLPNLELLTKNREAILLFDRDLHFNFQVKYQLKELGEKLIESGATVTIAVIPENCELKGIDDILAAKGKDAVNAILQGRRDYHSWVESNEGSLTLKPSDSVISATIARLHRSKLGYRKSMDEFYLYIETQGYWMILGQPNEKEGKSESIEDFVQRTMREDLGLTDFSEPRIKSIVSLLKRDLKLDWKTHPMIRNFTNGYYNTATETFLEQWDRSLFITDQPAYRYDPSAQCPTWLKHLNVVYKGDLSVIKAMQCAFNLVVRPNPNYQKYLQLLGLPGTGKSTTFNTLQKLMGKSNCFNTSLSDLEDNKYIMYTLITKALVLIPDAEKYEGSAAKLKKLTGRDRMPLEAKYRQPSEDARFEGMLAISANDSIRFNYDGGALMRRRLCFWHEDVIPESLIDLHLEEKIDKEIPGIFNWAMDVTEEDVENYLMRTAEYCPKLHAWNIEEQTNTDTVAEWADNSLILDPRSRTQIGKKTVDSMGNLEFTSTKLYPNYRQYCEESGYSKPVSSNEFKGRMTTYIKGNLKAPGVSFIKPQGYPTVEGLRLRGDSDVDYPTLGRQVLGLRMNAPEEVSNTSQEVVYQAEEQFTSEAVRQAVEELQHYTEWSEIEAHWVNSVKPLGDAVVYEALDVLSKENPTWTKALAKL